MDLPAVFLTADARFVLLAAYFTILKSGKKRRGRQKYRFLLDNYVVIQYFG
jgi:hypothetical protein